MLELYAEPCTVNCRKVLAGLDLLSVPYTLTHVDFGTDAHKAPAYLKVNPMGTLPAAIVDHDLTITESNAILQYAADLSARKSAYPADLKRRADVNRWLLWEASAWFPSCYVYMVEVCFKPLGGEQTDWAVVEAQAPRWKLLAGILDEQLSRTEFLAGEEITIADIAVAAPMHLHERSGFPLDEFPHLKRWMTERIETLPCWRKTQGAVDESLMPGTRCV